MGRVVHLGQVLEVEPRIDLRGGDVGVAQQLLHGAQVAARLQQVARERVAQHVRVHGRGQARELAALAQKQPDRPYAYGGDTTFRTEAQIDVRIRSEDPVLHKLVIDYLQTHRSVCPKFCVVLDLGKDRDGKRDVALVEQYGYQRVSLPADTRVHVGNARYDVPSPFDRASKVEIRAIEQRYIFVDGRRVGEPLD